MKYTNMANELNLDNVINLVVAIFVGAIMAAALIPTALVLLYNTTLTNVPTEVVVLYNVIGIAIVIAVIVLFFKMAGKI